MKVAHPVKSHKIYIYEGNEYTWTGKIAAKKMYARDHAGNIDPDSVMIVDYIYEFQQVHIKDGVELDFLSEQTTVWLLFKDIYEVQDDSAL